MIEFFADVGSNWIHKSKGGSFNRAMHLIDDAASCGCTGVKFQYFKAEHLWADKMKMEQSIARYRELPFDWIRSLSNYAKYKKLLFGLSVFDIESVKKVNPFVDYFKIASFEAGWFDLVKACYETGKRLQISIGQINKQELMELIVGLPEKGNQIDILHCISKYPSKIEDCNLNVIKKNNFLINGYSDHTVRSEAVLGAVMSGADIIEFHLDDGGGLEKEHSWTPWLIGDVIKTVKNMEIALGSDDWDYVASQQDHKYKANPETGLRG